MVVDPVVFVVRVISDVDDFYRNDSFRNRSSDDGRFDEFIEKIRKYGKYRYLH